MMHCIVIRGSVDLHPRTPGAVPYQLYTSQSLEYRNPLRPALKMVLLWACACPSCTNKNVLRGGVNRHFRASFGTSRHLQKSRHIVNFYRVPQFNNCLMKTAPRSRSRSKDNNSSEEVDSAIYRNQLNLE